MHFQRVLIEDFRGFWLISRFSTVFEHRFERFQLLNGFQMRLIWDEIRVKIDDEIVYRESKKERNHV